jgi:hypothetical protein
VSGGCAEPTVSSRHHPALHRSRPRPAPDRRLVCPALAGGVTFREARDRLGVGTQRQWSDLAVAGMTPCLLGLFSFEEQSFYAIKMLLGSL